MKKSDIVIGEKYAIKTGLSKYASSYGPAEVLGFEVIPVHSRSYYGASRRVTGVRVRYPDEGVPVSLKGKETVVETKYVERPWAEKVKANKEAEKAAEERKAYAEKNEALAKRLKEALAEVGIKADVTGYRGVKVNAFYGESADFTEVDAIERLIEILENEAERAELLDPALD